MSRVPWDPAEIGSHDPDLDEVAAQLGAYAVEVDSAPDPTLAPRIHAALDAEPIPLAHWWQRGALLGAWQGPARLLAAAVVVAVGVLGGLALGELTNLMQGGGTGSSPAPILSPSPSPTETPSPSPSPTASPSPSTTPTGAPTATPTDEVETPEPDDDNSGPGGGGGNSGPGGGGDNSGPGGG